VIQRRKRAVEVVDPAAMPLAEAYRLEMGDAWPSGRVRREFWSRPDVPAHLQNASEPDPRVLLRSRPDVDAYRRRVEVWQRARLGWLEDVARG
jgi:hypothetical protein